MATVRVGDRLRDPQQVDPFDVVSGDGQLWATARADRAVVRIDPVTNKIVASVHIGITTTGLAITGHTLWAVSDPTGNTVSQNDDIVAVDLRSRRVVSTLHGHSYPLGNQLAATADAIWVLTPGGATQVERLTPVSGTIVATIAAAPQPESLAIGAGAVWVINQQGTTLTRIDARTNTVAATLDLSRYAGQKSSCACLNVAVGLGAVWVIARDHTLLRIDPRSNSVTAALSFKRPVADVAVGDGSVWVGADDKPTVIDRIDPRALR